MRIKSRGAGCRSANSSGFQGSIFCLSPMKVAGGRRRRWPPLPPCSASSPYVEKSPGRRAISGSTCRPGHGESCEGNSLTVSKPTDWGDRQAIARRKWSLTAAPICRSKCRRHCSASTGSGFHGPQRGASDRDDIRNRGHVSGGGTGHKSPRVPQDPKCLAGTSRVSSARASSAREIIS